MSEGGENDAQHSGFLGGMGGIQMMGIVNALKTGDPTTDLVIAMCIPFILRLLFKMAERWESLLDLERWIRLFLSRRQVQKYERFVEYKRSRDQYGTTFAMDNDTQNPVLLKAIQLYVHRHCNLSLPSANLDLTSIETNGYGCNYYDDYDDSSDEDTTTVAGMLRRYAIIEKPPQNVWHDLGTFGSSEAVVQLCINEQEQEDSTRNKRMSTLYHFVSSGVDAIDDFINQSYQWYLNELRQMEDNSRHLYELKSVDSGFTYTRYRLSDEKTFESLFFRQKESLLKAIDHFQNKSGKYSIKGYPHKLGLLLHGSPGTGKTSMIKALAHYTGRSIVNVSLSKISTNSELMSIFFDRKFYIEGEYVPVQLGFKDVIFVIEDVDAASKVVKRRGSKKMAEREPEFVSVPAPKSIWRVLLESNDNDCRELVNLLMDMSERLEEEATKPEGLRSISKRVMAIPGLGFVGEGQDGDAIDKLGREATESASDLMESYEKVERFLSFHARSLMALIDAGAQVDEAFVDELLGVPSQSSDGTWVIPSLASSRSSPVCDQELDDQDDAKAIGSDEMIAEVARMFETEGPNKKAETPSGKTSSGMEGFGPSSWIKAGKDQLNLAGLLNVLDGVVDTPGRILIMTTNHPEMLDPALIRPGRIDKKIMMGYMDAADVADMLNHYFPDEELTESHRRRVELVINGDGDSRPKLSLTPAQVEQLCAEHDFIEDMIHKLEERR